MLRRWMIASVCLTMTGVAIALTMLPGLSRAHNQAAKPEAEESISKAVQLPIAQVVMFSSGVGYFQREGTVTGDARIDLTFPVADINDLIKSMVLRDLDGGAISTVSYDSNAPIDRTLRSFAVNFTGKPTFADILDQTRGEKVEVSLANAGAGTLSGTLMGVEKQNVVTANKDTTTQASLNLWCSDGMRSIKMADVQRVRYLNANLDSEIKKALETLALSHDTQKKSMSIRCVGEGNRRVKVGYVVENPIWKTSYRLVLGKKAEEAPYLQGWAVVENTTDEDWKDVRMSLISGRPISFQMDLYQPLFVRRPSITLDLFEGLNPVAYSGSMRGLEDTVGLNYNVDRIEEGEAKAKSEPTMAGGLGGMPAENAQQKKAMRFGGGRQGYVEESRKQLQEKMSLSSITPAASAAKLGDFFQYSIDRPVSLNRQKSALLPIVGKDVKATRVSIYNERVQAKFPLLGLKVKNTSGTHLMQGPITVFEGSSYAGDARIQDLQPDEERLISFAVDLGTEVAPAPATSNGRITHLKAVKGVIHQTQKIRDSRIYTAKNRNDQERTLLLEHPVRNEFKLVDCKPVETASDVHRFEMKVPAGQSKALTVTEERDVVSTISISTQNDDGIRWFMSQGVMSEKMKAGLTKAMELRWSLNKSQRERQHLETQLREIVEDQTRIRANLKEVSKTEKVYQRYIDKLDTQETQIEKLKADIKKLQETEHSQNKAFQDFLANFDAE